MNAFFAFALCANKEKERSSSSKAIEDFETELQEARLIILKSTVIIKTKTFFI